MNVPNFVHEKAVDESGNFTSPWQEFFSQLRQNMQQALSNEGFLIPNQSDANMLSIQNGVDENGNQIALPGTLIFNTDTVNGGSLASPNGQLYILLQDGVFHPITNT